MTRRRRQHECVPGDHLALDVADVRLERQQSGVHRAGLKRAHQIGGLVLAPDDRESRIGLAERGGHAARGPGFSHRLQSEPDAAERL